MTNWDDFFVNPFISMPKTDYVELVINLQGDKIITDMTIFSWSLELAHMTMTWIVYAYFQQAICFVSLSK